MWTPCCEAPRTYWRDFSSRCPTVGPWTDIVKRSLITLKALTYMPTGGIVAAATTSLPEQLGGTRNWDYRFCWLRDATMTLQAFMNLGYYEEATAWREWLMRAIAGAPEQMQIMYGVSGERHLLEWEVPWLDGYGGSRPVRIGNAAAEQFQLDVYGEVADAMMQALRGGLPAHPRTRALRDVILPFLEQAWRRPDKGIWEVRGGPQHFTHSKVMAWVAFDRAASLAADGNGNGSRRRAGDGWPTKFTMRSAERPSMPNSAASCRPMVRARSTRAFCTFHWSAFCRRTTTRHRHGQGHRERTDSQRAGSSLSTDEVDDGLPPGEGAFLACSFWLADVLVLLGRTRGRAPTVRAPARPLQ